MLLRRRLRTSAHPGPRVNLLPLLQYDYNSTMLHIKQLINTVTSKAQTGSWNLSHPQ